jgi:beta-lactamase regulating signal transducer with metallopeptidase domain
MKEFITLIQPAFAWTWKNSLQAAVLIGLVLLLQKILGRWLTPRLRYALSLLIVLRLLLPTAPPSPISLENLFTPAAQLTAAPATAGVPESVQTASSTGAPVAPSLAPVAPSPLSGLSTTEVLCLGWACGLLILVSLAGWRYVQWCRLIRQGHRVSDARLLALLDGARQAMGVCRPVTLVSLSQLGSPAVFGLRHVRLLLPETALDQLTDQELRLLFLHEMAHVSRRDMLLDLLLMAVQFLHWFNPLVWLGLHRLRADRELVCDAMVLQRTSPGERSGYGGLLIKLMDDFPAAQRIIPTAIPVLSSKREIKRRIVSIKHYGRASIAAWVATGMAAVTLACLTFTSSSQPRPGGQPLLQSGIKGQPADKAATQPTCVDLSKYYTAQLNDSLNSPSQVTENNLASLPKGRQVFSGVPFEVGGLLQLSGKKIQEWGRNEYPESITGIMVGKACQRLHLLHGAGGVFDPENVTIAKLVLHYADQSVREIDIQTAVHIRDWWGDPKQRVIGDNSVLTWTGTNPALKKYGGEHPGSLRIYKTTYGNPQPGSVITRIDYVSTMRNSSPFLIALTLE